MRRWATIRVAALATALLLPLLVAAAALAHEVRPAYLELREQEPGTFAVLWKVPMRGDMRLALKPEFSGKTRPSLPAVRILSGAAIETWYLEAPALRGQTLTIAGLAATMTDVLAHIEYADGSTWTQRLTPNAPSAAIPARDTILNVAGLYLLLGIEHILFGIDHLLFVFALLMLTQGIGSLVKTITAFTLTHSITLALATLGLVNVPLAPVEAVIALSIVFVAAEIVHRDQGREGMAARAPWLVAFGFGLLHGFGFAGALSETGLPAGHVPLALLFFNVGVEIGQLLFVAAVLALAAAVLRIPLPLPTWGYRVPAYAIGSVAMFWTVQRLAMF
ncbi:membrane protein, putative (plasmid) [Sinorhizobium sojae CCBAU 05684]|uniref:Membrane protein, putative n=1 Tax=Sinorhizobium sojae CCBAU 05684 TaxID=716928 RepID=A0A249PGV4_9HYPH|nr:HupE/UreJ family protein [Sinorhizobium sojae]ASY65183.1 membrane protein, putative [Sinorhizobium sojae CCBAU 05684]